MRYYKVKGEFDPEPITVRADDWGVELLTEAGTWVRLPRELLPDEEELVDLYTANPDEGESPETTWIQEIEEVTA